jgi:hypothetical protein
MCDYSLAGVPNRLAVEGEQLVVQRFSTGALGLASPTTHRAWLWSVKECAVCVPPGARLLLRDTPQPAAAVRCACDRGSDVCAVER